MDKLKFLCNLHKQGKLFLRDRLFKEIRIFFNEWVLKINAKLIKERLEKTMIHMFIKMIR